MLKNLFMIEEFSTTYEYKTTLILDPSCLFFLFHVVSLFLNINAIHHMPKFVLLPAPPVDVHIYFTLFYFGSFKKTAALTNKIKSSKWRLLMGKMTHQERCLTWPHGLISHSQYSLPPYIFPSFYQDGFRDCLSQL